MIKLFEFWGTLTKSKRPDSKSFHNVKKGIDDPLTVVKLNIFAYVAGLLQPFLTVFQGDGPLLPFLCANVKELIVALLGLIVKTKAIEEAKTSELLQLPENKKNLLATKNVHLGFAAETELQNLLRSEIIDEEQATNLREEAMVFIKACIAKLAERNPLMSSIVRNCEAFSPNVIASKSHNVLKTKVKNLIQKVVGLKLFEFKVGDRALTDFTKFLADEAVMEKQKFLDFKRAEKRLDDFYFKDLKVNKKYPSFSTLLKLIFTLSHGQASVERGFNDNNVVLKDNISSNSVIARRFLKNYMRVNDVQPSKIQISRELLKSVKCSRQRYETHLEDQRKESKQKEKNTQLTQVENEIKSINSECATIEKTISTFNSEIFAKLSSAVKILFNELRCKMMVIEMNALKRKCDEKEEQLGVLRKRAKELHEKKKALMFSQDIAIPVLIFYVDIRL